MSCDADFRTRPRSCPNECVCIIWNMKTPFFHWSRKQCLPNEHSQKTRQIIAKNKILWQSLNTELMLLSLYNASTVRTLNALALKNCLKNNLNAKISNWVNKRIFNELRCWFSKASKVLPKWIPMYNMTYENTIFFHLSRKWCHLNEHG